ncbi:hypothetical protein I79_009852 [Cricetulus griseus]|uniref:Uncharacterized protein n=1 Tax=Cricetulus griseus TaxID=10029 RepID=G3HGW0_CRIGR|nr:hypothetical protein I79_009852 [Cricetulus griseus]
MPIKHICPHLFISPTGKGENALEQDCSQHRQVFSLALDSSSVSEIALALWIPARLSRLIQVKPTKVPCKSSPTELQVSLIF